MLGVHGESDEAPLPWFGSFKCILDADRPACVVISNDREITAIVSLWELLFARLPAVFSILMPSGGSFILPVISDVVEITICLGDVG